MKTLTQTINEALAKVKLNDAVVFPEGTEVIMISPNDMKGSLVFMSIEDIKKEGGLDKVLELGPWESTVIDENIYVKIVE